MNSSSTLYRVAAVPFEAACHIPVLDSTHSSFRLHGHSYRTRLRAVATVSSDENLLSRLQQAVAPLHYSLLNDHIAVPTDENIVRWIYQRLDNLAIDNIGVQSTVDQGVDIDAAGYAHIWHKFRFEAAHQLPNVPSGHQCGRMHGHGFEVIIHCRQQLDGADMGVDFDYLQRLWQPLQQQLHHHCLNDITGLENPTSEVLANWIWQRLAPKIASLSWVTTYETHSSGCHYDGSHYRIWKEQRFESAIQYSSLQSTTNKRGLTGHSYIARLHLLAPLDEVYGWTVDYGDVKRLFTPLYTQLDHHTITDNSAMADGDLATIAGWIAGNLSPQLPQLDRIDLYETPGCGVVLQWGEQGTALPV